MKRLYIHIGMPKTGSSAIQAMLAYNQKVINNFNYSYPWHPGFGQAFNTSAGNARIFSKWIVDQDINTFTSKLMEITEENVILSSEVLFHTLRLHPEKFAKLLKGFDYKIICYVRKIDDLVDSCINQLVKNHNLTSYDNINKIIEEHNYSKVLINASKFICKSKFIVRPYDTELFKNRNIIDDFFECINLKEITNSDSEEIKMPTEIINPSLSPESLEFRRYLNKTKFEDKFNVDKFKINNLLATYSVEKNKTKYNILSIEQRKSIFDSYSNDEIELNNHFFSSKKRIFNSPTNKERDIIKTKNIEDLLYYLKEKKLPHFDAIPSLEKKRTFNDFKEIKTALDKIKNEDKHILLSALKNKLQPIKSICHYNFYSNVVRVSRDTNFSTNESYIELTSTGKDPFFITKLIPIDNIKPLQIDILIESDVESTFEVRYQTNNDPVFNRKKIVSKKVNIGMNYISLTIKDHDKNGKFRFDPIKEIGNLKIFNINILQ